MAEPRINRKLAAVLAADVVGFARLMEADEVGTLTALKQHRELTFDPAVAAHNGRLVKLIGDGAIVEFGSVVDAVNCALTIQRDGARQPTNGSAPAIVLRIGINLGDVIIEDSDIYGDGVNVAARLEASAKPGGICVSSIVHESVGNRVDARFADGGSINVKNIDRPISTWNWHPAGADIATALQSTAQTVRKASIAVLPFTNMSGDAEQEYFSDGISEDIITDLSKLSSLLVIARNSSFTYKGRSTDIRTVGRELGVTSVLEGSVRRSGNRVRITAQLIDTATGGHLWAERFDRELSDIFAVQDDVTGRIVDALKLTLSPAEKIRIAGGGTNSIEAYDQFLRGRDALLGQAVNREGFEASTQFFSRAIELDPSYSLPYMGLALAGLFDHQNRWSPDSSNALKLSRRNVNLAIEKDADEPFARIVDSRVATFEGDFARAKAAAEVGLALSPNSAEAYASLGETNLFSGHALEAIPLIERAAVLNPAYTQQYLHLLGVANLIAGKYETAAALLRQRILMAPKTDFSRAVLSSALGHLGGTDEARRVWRELMEINPQYTFAAHFRRLPFANKADVQLIADGLAKAELPT
jgi:adenylate cyclase